MIRKIDYNYRLQLFLLFLIYLQICPAGSDDYDEQEGVAYLNYLPASDRSFVMDYMTFINSKNPPIFIPTVIVCIIVGLIGNICFYFFFGNKMAKIYNTRDALFFRWMSAVDFLVCCLVLPYNILWEAKMVDNQIVCKVGEYFRHALTYVSHLIMLIYALQLGKKDYYYLVTSKLKVAMIFTIGLALVISLPAPFIFEVGATNDFGTLLKRNISQVRSILLVPLATYNKEFDGQQEEVQNHFNRLQYFNPGFCHMSFNLDKTTATFRLILNLKWIHVILNSMLFLLFAVTTLAKTIRYIDYKILNEPRMSVDVLQVTNPKPSKTIRLDQDEKQKKRNHMEELPQCISDVCSIDGTLTGGRETYTQLNNQDCSILPRTTSSLGENMGGPGTNVDVPSYRTETRTDLETTNRRQDLHRTKKSKLRKMSRIKNDLPELEMTRLGESHVDLSLYDTAPAVSMSLTESCVESLQTNTISLKMFFCACECFKHPRRQIRRLDGVNFITRSSSYKGSIICLIIIDFFMICTAAIGYIISKEVSIFLNLMHFKSVFSFYIVSFINAELYNATWANMPSSLDVARPSIRSAESVKIRRSKIPIEDDCL